MYKVLIVEDEEFERLSLEKILANEIINISKITAVSNAYEALEACTKEIPDIIFMDINIPGMDGLSLIKELKSLYKTPSFLIVSSYSDFEYAKTAITLGVKDYILKPYKINTLIESVSTVIEGLKKSEFNYQQTSRLVDKVKKITPLLEEECLYAILSNQSEIELNRKFSLLQYLPISCFCLIIEAKKEVEDNTQIFIKTLEDIGYRCLKSNINGNIVIYILYSGQLQKGHMEVINPIIEKNMVNYSYGVGTIYNQMSKFSTSYKEAINSLKQKKAISNSYNNNEFGQSTLSTYINNILKYFKEENEAKISEIVKLFSSSIMNESIDDLNKQVKDFITLLAQSIEKETNSIMDIDSIMSNLMTQKDKRHNLEFNLLFMVNQILKPAKDLQYRNTNYFVKKTMEYINNNYSKPIGLNEVSKTLGVTPYYISRLLNQHSHKNFNYLLNEIRINEAKKLLKTRKSVKEVSSLVGYQNQSYFSKLFKENVGLSPKVYKQMFE